MIRSENLCFSYNGSAQYILDNISLYIKDGEYVSILGENGSGKSTLIKLMLKLLKPTRGTIVCDTRRIGYVPQKNDFSNAQFPITVYEMLNSYRKLLRIKGKNDIIESLNWVRMSEYKDALVGTLSGGQCQKIFIARALIGNPQLLILDEPSTGVDANSQKEIYGFIKKVNAENGITIVSVEHNLDAAMKNSTLIYHLSASHGHLCTPQKYINEFLNSGDGDEAGA
jgi:zinc transport system ATP-binding protein